MTASPRGSSGWAPVETGSGAVDHLIGALDLDRDGGGLFHGVTGPARDRRVYGGLLLAQSAVAAARTGPEGGTGAELLEGVRGHFVRPADSELEVTYQVTSLREGSRVRVRRVDAYQGDQVVCTTTCSFLVPGVRSVSRVPEHADRDAGPGEPSAGADDSFAPGLLLPGRGGAAGSGLQVRRSRGASSLDVWLRVAAALPDDPLLHRVLTVYLSDVAMISAMLVGLDLAREQVVAATLEHGIWLHGTGRVDQWVHHAMRSPAVGGGRGWSTGAMFGSDGALVAVTNQRSLVEVG